MINGAHVIIYSKDAEADRLFFKNVLKFNHVDVGGGWLIFALPPAEVAVHPSDENSVHELFLMCDGLDLTMKDLAKSGVACEPVTTQSWGRSTQLKLPGGGTIGLYEPHHARPKN